MFNFCRDDGGFQSRPTYRMTNYKHNPYVGSFHSTDRSESNCNLPTNIVDYRNGLLPMFRHSPAQIAAEGPTLGLKSLLFKQNFGFCNPILTQIQLSQEFKRTKRLAVVQRAMLNLPTSIFDNSSVDSEDKNNNDSPVCSICLEAFCDGDELRTLKCSHCYHKACVDIWLLGCLSTETADTCNCPDCRQTVESHHESSDAPVVNVDNSDIPSMSFIRIGRSMSSGGDDREIPSNDSDSNLSYLCNDLSTDNLLVDIDLSNLEISEYDTIEDDLLNGSGYLDCGFPLNG